MTIPEAYRVCREVARKEAKNFYYAFRVLPRHKSDAMCAVYAFMRKADDLSDDESVSIPDRRLRMAAWIHSWRLGDNDDAVFVALKHTQERFGISNDLLEQLVQGTVMDLEPVVSGESGLQTYSNFDELYGYCYLVASVVGLVCIRIFGYSDVRAEKLAEETGVAFQLTNILRDIKEDAARGRVYLPLDALAEHDVTLQRLEKLTAGATVSSRERALILSMAKKAEEYYGSASKLLPFIEPDSRAALWVLVTIYHELLRRILDRNGDVFSERVAVPTGKKIWILTRGGLKALANRTVS